MLGLGDLGRRVVDVLASRPGGRLVAAARDAEHARAVAGQAALVAALCGGPRTIEPAVVDLDDATAPPPCSRACNRTSSSSPRRG